MSDEKRTILAADITDEWIGWQIRPLRDEFIKGQGGLDGMLITHGRTFELKSIRKWEYQGKHTVGLVAKAYDSPFSGVEYHYTPETVIEINFPVSAKAKKGAKALGYDNRKHRWMDDEA